MRKLSGINFNYTYMLHLVLSELTWQKLSSSLSSKNPEIIKIVLKVPNLLNMFNTMYYIK